MTRLVVGLGNPGTEYQWTRHNVGFHVLDRILAVAGGRNDGALFRSARRLEGYNGPRDFSWARLGEPDAFLLRPETYMNRSGDVVAPMARFLFPQEQEDLQLNVSKVMVVYDDIDLDLGRLRIRPHGGHGGQNGMRSIITHLGTDQFPRLRVGVGPSGTDAARHVLQLFPDKDRAEAEISIAEAAEAILDWLGTGDLEGCMTRYHSRWNQES